MQIFSAEQTRLWDEFTIRNEPIPSIDLMERAATRCVEWLETHQYLDRTFIIFCGKGNNGGDGLVIARLLSERECHVSVNILEFGHKGTDDFQLNLARLHQTAVEIRFIQSEAHFNPIPKEYVVIDALFGSGLNRPLEGLTVKLIEHINNSGAEIIAVDIPSGLYVDKSSAGNAIIRATYTLNFQSYKLAFLVAENEPYMGTVQLLDIGLHPDYLHQTESRFTLTDTAVIRSIFRPRKKFAHKGNFGHALLIAGSEGKMGAAVLAARACLRSGVGLLSVHIPGCGYTVLQTAVPEAMVITDEDDRKNTTLPDELSKYTVIGTGPGLGTHKKTKELIQNLLQQYRQPMVLDADALNILAAEQSLLGSLSPHSILTPHPKEFERLFGASANDFERIHLACTKAAQYQVVIVLKGHYTFIALPDGKGYFNATGNAGMAKGGSGDVLTGILTALVSQRYTSEDAAVLGVYLHGLAGDIAADVFSLQAMLPNDLIHFLGKAYLDIEKKII